MKIAMVDMLFPGDYSDHRSLPARLACVSSQVAVSLVCVVIFGACVETDPQMLFDPCVHAASIGMEPNQTKDVTCDLKASTMLAAIPGGTPTVTELVDKGLPETVAELVSISHDNLVGSRWCFARFREGAHEPTADRVVCVESQTHIGELFVARGHGFRLTLSRGNGESVSIVAIRPSKESQ